MIDLPEVRRADCGHGFVPVDIPPAARTQNGQHEQPVYLCDDCRARLHAPSVETKVVEPEVATTKMRSPWPISDEVAADEDPYQLGRLAGAGGAPRTLPSHIKHPRSAEGREYFRGYDEAKARSEG